MKKFFVVIAVLMVSGSAFAADWQNLSWGMTAEEVQAAREGKLSCPRKANSGKIPDFLCQLKGGVVIDGQKYDAVLYFKGQALYMVALERAGGFELYDSLRTLLTAKYGKRIHWQVGESGWQAETTTILLVGEIDGSSVSLTYAHTETLDRLEDERNARVADSI